MLRPIQGRGLEFRLGSEYEIIHAYPDTQLCSPELQSLIRDISRLGRFLARIEIVAEQPNTFIFVQSTENGEEVASRSVETPIDSLPQEDVEKLRAGIAELKRIADLDKTDADQRLAIERFQLPNPSTHPEFYRTYKSGGRKRLLILWGFERTGGMADGYGASLRPEDAARKLNQGGMLRLPWGLLLPALLVLALALVLTYALYHLADGPSKGPATSGGGDKLTDAISKGGGGGAQTAKPAKGASKGEAGGGSAEPGEHISKGGAGEGGQPVKPADDASKAGGGGWGRPVKPADDRSKGGAGGWGQPVKPANDASKAGGGGWGQPAKPADDRSKDGAGDRGQPVKSADSGSRGGAGEGKQPPAEDASNDGARDAGQPVRPAEGASKGQAGDRRRPAAGKIKYSMRKKAHEDRAGGKTAVTLSMEADRQTGVGEEAGPFNWQVTGRNGHQETATGKEVTFELDPKNGPYVVTVKAPGVKEQHGLEITKGQTEVRLN